MKTRKIPRAYDRSEEERLNKAHNVCGSWVLAKLAILASSRAVDAHHTLAFTSLTEVTTCTRQSEQRGKGREENVTIVGCVKPRSQQILHGFTHSTLSRTTVQVSATPTCTRLVYSWCLTCTEWRFVRRGKSHVTLNALRAPAHSGAALTCPLFGGCCRDFVSVTECDPEILISL